MADDALAATWSASFAIVPGSLDSSVSVADELTSAAFFSASSAPVDAQRQRERKVVIEGDGGGGQRELRAETSVRKELMG